MEEQTRRYFQKVVLQGIQYVWINQQIYLLLSMLMHQPAYMHLSLTKQTNKIALKHVDKI